MNIKELGYGIAIELNGRIIVIADKHSALMAMLTKSPEEIKEEGIPLVIKGLVNTYGMTEDEAKFIWEWFVSNIELAQAEHDLKEAQSSVKH